MTTLEGEIDNPMASATVLYVEDEEGDLFFMRLAFKKAGAGLDLRTVEDGQTAMNYLAGTADFTDRQQHPLPAVLLLDLNLPVISGFDVLTWLRARDEFKALPVVVFSSSAREEDRRKALELGANEYVEKPNSALLFTGLVQALRNKWLAGGPAR